MSGKPPFTRLSECHEELTQEGFETKVDKQNEVFFYINVQKTIQSHPNRNLTENEIQQHARNIVVENHNLHLFKNEDLLVVSTRSEEQTKKYKNKTI